MLSSFKERCHVQFQVLQAQPFRDVADRRGARAPRWSDRAQGPEYVTYNSMHGDPKPRAFDEEMVAMWNEAHPLVPVEHSIIAHEDFKQAIRAYLTAEPAPDVLTWFAGERARFFIDKGLIADFPMSSPITASTRRMRRASSRWPRWMASNTSCQPRTTGGRSTIAPRCSSRPGSPKSRRPGRVPGRVRHAQRGGDHPHHDRHPLSVDGGCLVRLSQYAVSTARSSTST